MYGVIQSDIRAAVLLTDLIKPFFFRSIFPSPDQELNPSVLPTAHNTGGSLPDLTNIQFPPPLSTPLDPEDTVAFTSLSSSTSTGSLTTNLTHLGISAASHGNNSCFMFIRWGDKRQLKFKGETRFWYTDTPQTVLGKCCKNISSSEFVF